MELLKQRILEEGRTVGEEILKVDSFLNHQIDAKLFREMGHEFRKRFPSKKITKLLTIEASGLAIATVAALEFDVPVVFAKKHIQEILIKVYILVKFTHLREI
jgi:xanthine phosphoribosyltransferase